jgi:hypothetical protein
MKSDDQNSVAIWTCRACEVDALIPGVDLERIAGILSHPIGLWILYAPDAGMEGSPY